MLAREVPPVMRGPPLKRVMPILISSGFVSTNPETRCFHTVTNCKFHNSFLLITIHFGGGEGEGCHFLQTKRDPHPLCFL